MSKPSYSEILRAYDYVCGTHDCDLGCPLRNFPENGDCCTAFVFDVLTGTKDLYGNQIHKNTPKKKTLSYSEIVKAHKRICISRTTCDKTCILDRKKGNCRIGFVYDVLIGKKDLDGNVIRKAPAKKTDGKLRALAKECYRKLIKLCSRALKRPAHKRKGQS